VKRGTRSAAGEVAFSLAAAAALRIIFRQR
jgi:hypothetical protein